MAKIERHSSLAKAPALDVVAALTAPTPPAEELPMAPRDDSASVSVASATAESERSAVSSPAVRRGPGRPRSRRRMEPFSSKIDIELRDRVDQYIEEHGTTFVDLIDEALRARIGE